MLLSGKAGVLLLTLSNIEDGKIFQRSAGETSGPVTVSGIYDGDSTGIQARVLLDADDSTVVDWTTIVASPTNDVFSGDITVPQGGPYYVQVRHANLTGTVKEGTTTFYVGTVIVIYGQSNAARFTVNGTSPPAAASGTRWFNGSSWTSVPAANGIRNLLNDLIGLTGVPVGALNGAISGKTVAQLSEDSGTSYFADLAAQIAASGGDAEFIVWHQGESDAAFATPAATYSTLLDALHQSIADEVSRTKAQIPFVVSSLATATGQATDANWWTIQGALVLADADHAAIHYSHSNLDAVLAAGDPVHLSNASNGVSGKRYASTIGNLLGEVADPTAWFIASIAMVDTTHTDVTLVHSLGTDFTPTSGITGFEISDDAGSNWEVPSAAVRQDATTIRLTHGVMDLGDARVLRYQYGQTPDVSGAVLDNSSLAVPLNHSANQTISVTPP